MLVYVMFRALLNYRSVVVWLYV